MIYRLRCRIGAWLLREHVAALCEHYDDAALIHHRGLTIGMPDHKSAQRCEYIGIGLRYSIGLGTRWRRLD